MQQEIAERAKAAKSAAGNCRKSRGCKSAARNCRESKGCKSAAGNYRKSKDLKARGVPAAQESCEHMLEAAVKQKENAFVMAAAVLPDYREARSRREAEWKCLKARGVPAAQESREHMLEAAVKQEGNVFVLAATDRRDSLEHMLEAGVSRKEMRLLWLHPCFKSLATREADWKLTRACGARAQDGP